ncbi:hypothetical protein [Sporosarcina gallistercoris]|uniref:Uncharacterized protein n=1 Tax=Sporosarcina gallistercoris TaxID=2762245 RepID=A0ABR8PHY9_9BACL|nr:hypothetical protein [Sporosarcina gallistercoris]MBD7907786.1 hypothetical protein [Sporosarcina gallistercoris]
MQKVIFPSFVHWLKEVNVSWEIQLIEVQDGDSWGLAQREDPAEAKRRGG